MDDTDDDGEMTLGGESQAILAYCDRVKVPDEESKGSEGGAQQLPSVPEAGDTEVLQAKPPVNDDLRAEKEETVTLVLDGQKAKQSSLIDSRSPTLEPTDRGAAEMPVTPALAASILNEQDKNAPSPIDLLTPNVEKGVAGNAQMPVPRPLQPNPPEDKVAPSAMKSNGQESGSPQSVTSGNKESSVRNTKLVGTTTKQIKEGKSVKTTFSAFDLALPGGAKKKKRKKKMA